MGPMEIPSSPAFPVLDPIIVDDDMESAFRDPDMNFLDPSRLQAPSQHAGDDAGGPLVAQNSSSQPTVDSECSSCLSPSDLSMKKAYRNQDGLRRSHASASDSPADSPENSTRSSSSDSPPNHFHDSSQSAVNGESAILPFGYSEDWVNSDLVGTTDDLYFGLDPGAFGIDTDIESSNKAMDAAFDFESAASDPNLLKKGVPSQSKASWRSRPQVQSPANNKSRSAEGMMASPVS